MFWSMNCDSWLEPKNSLIAADDRLGVDQFLRHQALGFGQGQALLHRALDTHQADAELVLRHLADAAIRAVAEMVDVVHGAAPLRS